MSSIRPEPGIWGHTGNPAYAVFRLEIGGNNSDFMKQKLRIRLYHSRGHITVSGYEYTIYGYVVDRDFIARLEWVKKTYPELSPWAGIPCDLWINPQKGTCHLTHHTKVPFLQ